MDVFITLQLEICVTVEEVKSSDLNIFVLFRHYALGLHVLYVNFKFG